MLSREDIDTIRSYCKENNVNLEQALQELSIPRHQYFNARRRYKEEESAELSATDLGDFIPIGASSSSTFENPPEKESVQYTGLSNDRLRIDLRFPSGTAMRLDGSISPSIIESIIRSASHVQS